MDLALPSPAPTLLLKKKESSWNPTVLSLHGSPPFFFLCRMFLMFCYANIHFRNLFAIEYITVQGNQVTAAEFKAVYDSLNKAILKVSSVFFLNCLFLLLIFSTPRNTKPFLAKRKKKLQTYNLLSLAPRSLRSLSFLFFFLCSRALYSRLVIALGSLLLAFCLSSRLLAFNFLIFSPTLTDTRSPDSCSTCSQLLAFSAVVSTCLILGPFDVFLSLTFLSPVAAFSAFYGEVGWTLLFEHVIFSTSCVLYRRAVYFTDRYRNKQIFCSDHVRNVQNTPEYYC